MKRVISLIALTLSVLPSLSHSYDAPLDFNYKADGGNRIRPMLIFNDGETTFIQPNKDQVITGGVVKVGPYYTVNGTPNRLIVYVNGHPVHIEHVAKSTTKPERPRGSHKVSGSMNVYKNKSDLILNKTNLLSRKVKEYGEQHGIEIVWQSDYDYQAKNNIKVKGEVPHIMLIDYLKSLGFEAGGSAKRIVVMNKIEGESK